MKGQPHRAKGRWVTIKAKNQKPFKKADTQHVEIGKMMRRAAKKRGGTNATEQSGQEAQAP